MGKKCNKAFGILLKSCQEGEEVGVKGMGGTKVLTLLLNGKVHRKDVLSRVDNKIHLTGLKITSVPDGQPGQFS